jgi:hypothetical protein
MEGILAWKTSTVGLENETFVADLSGSTRTVPSKIIFTFVGAVESGPAAALWRQGDVQHTLGSALNPFVIRCHGAYARRLEIVSDDNLDPLFIPQQRNNSLLWGEKDRQREGLA